MGNDTLKSKMEIDPTTQKDAGNTSLSALYDRFYRKYNHVLNILYRILWMPGRQSICYW